MLYRPKVTGSSVGLGRAVVEHVLSQGGKVVATCRKTSDLDYLAAKYPSSQLVVVRLDVTIASEITAAFSRAIEAFGRVDVVYNNAGFLVIAEIEGTTDESARSIFEVNFWAAANVTREAVRVFRDLNSPPGGRILQASSQGGIQAIPAVGYYCATSVVSQIVILRPLMPYSRYAASLRWRVCRKPCKAKYIHPGTSR
jgi:NAD(P)-dependent dehydrogenase (short-subunit alcohol dehydrogenase family)